MNSHPFQASNALSEFVSYKCVEISLILSLLSVIKPHNQNSATGPVRNNTKNVASAKKRRELEMGESDWEHKRLFKKSA